MPEISTIFSNQIPEFMKVKGNFARIKNFQKVGVKGYRLDLVRDGTQFELVAQITIQDGYPEKSCIFSLSLVSVPVKGKGSEKASTVTKFADDSEVEPVLQAIAKEINEH